MPITWQDSAGNTVETGDRRYFESGKHVLVINNLVESDEERYSCSSINGIQSTPILLNVTGVFIVFILFPFLGAWGGGGGRGQGGEIVGGCRDWSTNCNIIIMYRASCYEQM